MKIKFNKGVFIVSADSAVELGRIFLRIQEFYESPNKEFKNQLFTVSRFKQWYRKNFGKRKKFTYYTDFCGYNVPGNAVKKFFSMYFMASKLNRYETDLFNLIFKAAGDGFPEKFYLIGILEKDFNTLNHELHHAFFYLRSSYKSRILKALGSTRCYRGLKAYLIKSMYSEATLKDELAAYLMFELDWLIIKFPDFSRYRETSDKLLAIFRKTLGSI